LIRRVPFGHDKEDVNEARQATENCACEGYTKTRTEECAARWSAVDAEGTYQGVYSDAE
jgi:hypothetical protein